jgi:CW-type Zinc Finger/Protein SET DOMAIN GROUP 2 C-terminal/SET domain
MALERPQTDPRGYGLLFVDASRKAGHGSSLSHSCAPTCEVRVAAFEGELCLAMTTLRELELGEELTFDYNAVTESLNEYRSAVCLCGYGRCRGSFLHFATADCYQQVLNRNSPIATRFASLVKGSMKQVMSQDDDQVLRNHGFLTASFGAISVNRRDASVNGRSESLVDSLDMVPVWLRTYVADALRYIEYERRALPIALICDHLSASKKAGAKFSATQLTKEPKPEPAFFYFSRTESDFILNLMKSEGFPESLTGLQLKHTMQKVASSYWNALTEEKKQYWKDKARADFEKKMKAWRTGKRKQPAVEKMQDKGRSKPEISEILHSSKISFQDADAEGVVAMEQRIQQLAQTLSRIGRVLDRHREESFGSDPQPGSDAECAESMQTRVQSPLRVLTDAEVVGWMWNNSNGAVPSLIRAVERSRCVRPRLLEALSEVRRRYSSLVTFGDPECLASEDTAAQPADGRHQLTFALLELRFKILSELKEMAKDFRLFRTQSSSQLADETFSQNSSEVVFSDDESVGKAPSMASDPASRINAPSSPETAESALPVSSEDIVSNMEASVAGVTASEENVESGNAGNAMKASKIDPFVVETKPWLDYYGERFTLHAAADLLLLYARTSNFFVMQPNTPLQSTPVEVYARELGNVVPRSVIDEGLADDSTAPTTVAVGRTPVKEGADQRPPRSQESNGRRSTDITTFPADLKRTASDLCAPDDIVAKVSVRYQGDYVLSQLLQWYNGGIGQKPGLPDLLGCTLLPSMSDCWSSDLLKYSKLKADRRTSYETKVRPRLVEWLQDPYQRGNPWPNEIRKAFVGDESCELQRDTSVLFLPFGSPIIDFLVTGDESNIAAVLNELDADDKIAAKKSADGLLSSVDKGRPAQAVSTWVQCERPECMKWRKIPWYVDADLLPERFFCEDNKWNPAANNCDAPEDGWDAGDALVGSDGKVEGSPVKKKSAESLSVLEESSFSIGSK